MGKAGNMAGGGGGLKIVGQPIVEVPLNLDTSFVAGEVAQVWSPYDTIGSRLQTSHNMYSPLLTCKLADDRALFFYRRYQMNILYATDVLWVAGSATINTNSDTTSIRSEAGPYSGGGFNHVVAKLGIDSALLFCHTGNSTKQMVCQIITLNTDRTITVGPAVVIATDTYCSHACICEISAGKYAAFWGWNSDPSFLKGCIITVDGSTITKHAEIVVHTYSQHLRCTVTEDQLIVVTTAYSSTSAQGSRAFALKADGTTLKLLGIGTLPSNFTGNQAPQILLPTSKQSILFTSNIGDVCIMHVSVQYPYFTGFCKSLTPIVGTSTPLFSACVSGIRPKITNHFAIMISKHATTAGKLSLVSTVYDTPNVLNIQDLDNFGGELGYAENVSGIVQWSTGHVTCFYGGYNPSGIRYCTIDMRVQLRKKIPRPNGSILSLCVTLEPSRDSNPVKVALL